MKIKQRILIGALGAVGKMGLQSQLVANKVGFLIGEQVGSELLEKGILAKEASYPEIWQGLNEAIEIDTTAFMEEDKEKIIITIGDCHICPKKVGKYSIPATACPVGGMFRGVCSVLGKTPKSESELTPGKICKIVITK